MLLSPPLIVFIAVSDFGAKKKKKLGTSSSIFAITPRQSSNPHRQEGLTNKIPHSPGTENKHVTCGQGLPGGRGVEVDWYITVIWSRNFPHFSPPCDNFAFTSL